jgi:hypothetical protein
MTAGRIARATQKLNTLEPECRPGLGDTWGELVLAFAELGDADQARAEAERVNRSAEATSGAKLAAGRALEHLARYGKSGGDQAAMLEIYDRALDAEHTGNHGGASQAYLEAWARFRPNPQALVRAGRVAARSGHAAAAQRFYDRALAELGGAPKAKSSYLDEAMGFVGVSPLQNEKAIAVGGAGVLQVLDATTFELLASYPAWLSSLVVSADGRYLATKRDSDEDTVDVFHARSAHRIQSFKLEGHAGGLAANPSFTRLAVAVDPRRVDVFEIRSGRRLARFEVTGYVNQLSFVDDDLLFGRYGNNNDHVGWSVERGAVSWKHEVNGQAKDGDLLDDRFVYVLVAKPAPGKKKPDEAWSLDLRTGKSKKIVTLDFIRGVNLASRNTVVVSTERDAFLHRLDTGEQIAVPGFGDGHVWSLAGGRVVVTDSQGDPPVSRLWDPATGKLSAFPLTSLTGLFTHGVTPKGRMLVWKDANTLVIREPDGTERKETWSRPVELTGVAVMPDGSGLVIGDGRGIRSLSFARPAFGWLGARGLPSGELQYTDDGRLLLAAGKELVVLEASSGELRHRLAHSNMAASISSDGTTVVAINSERELIWDLRTGSAQVHDHDDEMTALGGDPRAAASCCTGYLAVGPRISPYVSSDQEVAPARGLSADGLRLALIGYGTHGEEDEDARRLFVFDTRTRARISELDLGSEPFVHEVVLDRTGRRAAAALGMHPVAWLLDVESKEATQLSAALELSFSRDGKYLVGLGEDAAKVWRASDGAHLGAFVLSKTEENAGAFLAGDGRVEWIGKPNAVLLTCAIGDVELLFEVCAERLVEPGLVSRTFAGGSLAATAAPAYRPH